MAPPATTGQHLGTYSLTQHDLGHHVYNNINAHADEVSRAQFRRRLALRAERRAHGASKRTRNNTPIPFTTTKLDSSPTVHANDQAMTPPNSGSSKSPAMTSAKIILKRKPREKPSLSIKTDSKDSDEPTNHGPAIVPAALLRKRRIGIRGTPSAAAVAKYDLLPRRKPRLRLITTAERAARSRTSEEEYRALLIWTHQVCQRADKHLAARHAADEALGSD